MVVEIKGKKVNIKDEEINKLMKTLEITEAEAVDTWLFDHDYVNNEQAQILIDKAKINKTDKLYVNDKTKRKQVERVVKVNENKKFLINLLGQTIKQVENVEQVNITNDQKLIEFTFNGKQYKLDLIEKRIKK